MTHARLVPLDAAGSPHTEPLGGRLVGLEAGFVPHEARGEEVLGLVWCCLLSGYRRYSAYCRRARRTCPANANAKSAQAGREAGNRRLGQSTEHGCQRTPE